MKMRLLILVVFLESLSLLPTARAEQRTEAPRRLFDSIITGRQVLPFSEFEQNVQGAASESGLPSVAAAALLQEFQSFNGRRVVPRPELQPFLLEWLYKNNISYSVARLFLDRLLEKTDGPVDTGFVVLVRTIDLGDRLVRKVGSDRSIRPPVPISQPLPLYTEAARAAKVEGLILLKCIVLEDGTVANCTVTRALGYGCDESALLTIQNRWRFRPGTSNGIPVAVEANIEVSMRLY